MYLKEILIHTLTEDRSTKAVIYYKTNEEDEWREIPEISWSIYKRMASVCCKPPVEELGRRRWYPK